TIFSKQALFSYGETEFTLIDTPGHIDFSAETERVMSVLDYALLVINGNEGVQAHTVTLWKLLEKYGVPCFIFVNKNDLSGFDKQIVFTGLQTKLSKACIDFSSGYDELAENCASFDDILLEKFYAGEPIIEYDIADSVARRTVFPCLSGSALKFNGIEKLLEIIDKYTKQPIRENDFAAKVFKISHDDRGERLTFMKITGGEIKVRDILSSEKNTASEKVNQIRLYSGEKYTTVAAAQSGTVCAVTGISFAMPGDGLGSKKNCPAPILEPILNYAVILPDGLDPHRFIEKLRILESEDPLLNVTWDERSGNIHIRVMGDIQLEILRSEISERFGIDVSFGQGGIVYKETIASPVEGVGHYEPLRHYAEVHLLLIPLKRGDGLVFRSDCREDILDKSRQKLILTHLKEKQHIGVLTGSPVTDMEFRLVSGKDHVKHTEGGDFRQATYRAVRQGLRSAESILLEPIYEFTLEVPSECIGKAISDIGKMHGDFDPPETVSDTAVITGTAPASEMCEYSKEVVRYTRGKGRLSCVIKGYDVCHNPDEVIASIGYDCDADTENTCDSIFCAHGAGFVVKWNEVENYMHLPKNV
ncbi:MAG: TetM/TetW/TetO/TetS family tetracycline resistance ribosomal protection protein, partial [Clostridia bacterium]|nr:TetM/TetW/TetO/TetS family tetracycline resistance ribosomal protection protein [Clostridia bacterium]